MSERTDEPGDTPLGTRRDTDAEPRTAGTNGDGAVLTEPSAAANPVNPALPEPEDELARAAAAAGPNPPVAAPPVRRRSRIGWLVWAGVVGTALVLAIVFGPRYVKRMGQLRIQDAAAGLARAPTLVAYEEQSERAAELLKAGGSYVAFPLSDAGGEPAPVVAGHVPAAWREFRRWAFPQSPEPAGPLLFLHERQTAVGVRGIVAVEADRAGRRLRVSFIRHGNLTGNPTAFADGAVKPVPKDDVIILSAGRGPFEAKLPDPANPNARADLRFFAGQADGENWTHFVIPYELNGSAGELELWVVDESTFHYLDRRFAKRG